MDDEELLESLKATVNLVEPIYVIESPSSEDLYSGRNEGDALAKTLRLADIEVNYFLVTDSKMLDRAFHDIGKAISNRSDIETVMPFIHVSAHGNEQGIGLTNDDFITWDKMTNLFAVLHEQVGSVEGLKLFGQDVPKTALCLSSCSTFEGYKRSLPSYVPFQCLVGPNSDIGWCQSLVGFSTFYYQAFMRETSYWEAVRAMNSAASSLQNPTFEILAPHVSNERIDQMRGFVIDSANKDGSANNTS